MFSTTFVGHQGWLFESEQAALLVDPLLSEEMGHGGAIGRVFPPRRLDLSAFPGVDAVLYTHEHEDHFSIPTLNRLDRRIPILLSARSSRAARTILAEMGFRVRLVAAGETVRIGDLEIVLFSPEHLHDPEQDEWDVLQFLVANEHGSLFCGVDAPVPGKTLRRVVELTGGTGLWTHTLNGSDWSLARAGIVEQTRPPPDTLGVGAQIAQETARGRFEGLRPAAAIFCGSGFSLEGERAFMNHRVFPVDAERICRALGALLPGETFLSPAPGQRIVMQNGALSRVDEATPFLAAAPRDEWPRRDYAPDGSLLEDYAPACGRHELSPEELDELGSHLEEFARHLYGQRLFRQLASADGPTLEGRKAALALVLYTDGDGGAAVFEYDVARCAFTRVECEDPAGEYVSGIECFATDLLALFRGHLAPTAVVFGRGRTWNFAPRKVDVSLALLAWFFHPLRRPEAYLTLYRRLLAAEPDGVARVAPGTTAAKAAQSR